MPKILYSMAGEGRGHATRARALVEAMRGDHEFVLFAPDDAYRLLEPTYRGTEVRVVEIPGLRFRYSKAKRVAPLRTGVAAARYARRLPGLVEDLSGWIRREQPDLILSDFEPALPRAARACGRPFSSLDHQSFLVVSDLSDLPLRLRAWARFMGWVVDLYYTDQQRAIVSSFHFPCDVLQRPSSRHQRRARRCRSRASAARSWTAKHGRDGIMAALGRGGVGTVCADRTTSSRNGSMITSSSN